MQHPVAARQLLVPAVVLEGAGLVLGLGRRKGGRDHDDLDEGGERLAELDFLGLVIKEDMEPHPGQILKRPPCLGNSNDRLFSFHLVLLSAFPLHFRLGVAVRESETHVEVCAFGYEAYPQTAEIALDGGLGVRVRPHGQDQAEYSDIWNALGEEREDD